MASLTTIEKMMLIRQVPIFAELGLAGALGEPRPPAEPERQLDREALSGPAAAGAGRGVRH